MLRDVSSLWRHLGAAAFLLSSSEAEGLNRCDIVFTITVAISIELVKTDCAECYLQGIKSTDVLFTA